MPFATEDSFYSPRGVAAAGGADMQTFNLFAELTLEQPAAQVSPLQLPRCFAPAQEPQARD
jgi:hypothetical protein